jgi:hypothetical protein
MTIFGQKEGWEELRGERFYELYCSPNITGSIKFSRMRLAVNVARMGKRTCAYRNFGGEI